MAKISNPRIGKGTGRTVRCTLCNQPSSHHEGSQGHKKNRWCPKPDGTFDRTKQYTPPVKPGAGMDRPRDYLEGIPVQV